MLAKADLLTDMVGEFPELQGIMGRYYALQRRPGPRDRRRDRGPLQAALCRRRACRATRSAWSSALADKLETLAGLFAIGQLPTGDKDPFALRRHALGVVRMLMEKDLPLALDELIAEAVALFPQADPKTAGLLSDFIYERLAGSLREQGYSAQEVDAVLALRPQRLGDVAKRLAAVRAFAALPEAAALAAANKRIGNILKKADQADAHVSEVLLQRAGREGPVRRDDAQVAPQAGAQFEAGDYTGSLQTLAALRGPVDAFFDERDGQCRRSRPAPEPPGPAGDPAPRHEPRGRSVAPGHLIGTS